MITQCEKQVKTGNSGEFLLEANVMSNEEIVIESMRCLEAGDIQGVANTLSEDFLVSVPGIEPLNKPGLIGFIAVLKEACPDLVINAKIIESRGETVKIMLEPTGTHTGVLRYPGITPVQPTGISIALPPGPIVSTIKDGKIFRTVLEDTSGGGVFGLLRQIGVSISEEGDKIEG